MDRRDDGVVTCLRNVISHVENGKTLKQAIDKEKDGYHQVEDYLEDPTIDPQPVNRLFLIGYKEAIKALGALL